MREYDITDEVQFDDNVGDTLPLRECACGYKFKSSPLIIGTNPDYAAVCKNCGRKMRFSFSIKVYEVV